MEVTDTGLGVSTENQKRIFEPYYGLRKNISHRGMGLGLSLSKMIIDLHGGTMNLESILGKGSQFSFFLPYKQGKAMKMLIIEDDSAIVEAIKCAFKLGWPGIEIISADWGQDGITKVETEAPDVVILDLGLPDINGLDVIKGIRKFSKGPHSCALPPGQRKR